MPKSSSDSSSDSSLTSSFLGASAAAAAATGAAAAANLLGSWKTKLVICNYNIWEYPITINIYITLHYYKQFIYIHQFYKEYGMKYLGIFTYSQILLQCFCFLEGDISDGSKSQETLEAVHNGMRHRCHSWITNGQRNWSNVGNTLQIQNSL